MTARRGRMEVLGIVLILQAVGTASCDTGGPPNPIASSCIAQATDGVPPTSGIPPPTDFGKLVRPCALLSGGRHSQPWSEVEVASPIDLYVYVHGGVEVCDLVQDVGVDETASSVSIRVTLGSLGRSCSTVAATYIVPIHLKSPLAGRPVQSSPVSADPQVLFYAGDGVRWLRAECYPADGHQAPLIPTTKVEWLSEVRYASPCDARPFIPGAPSPWDMAVVDGAGRLVSLYFQGGTPRCHLPTRIDLRESPSAIVVDLHLGDDLIPDSGSRSCTLSHYVTNVELPSPLGTRALLTDAASTGPTIRR